jgi:hypothetical protein
MKQKRNTPFLLLNEELKKKEKTTIFGTKKKGKRTLSSPDVFLDKRRRPCFY